MTRLAFLGDAALLLEVEGTDLLSMNADVHRLASIIVAAHVAGVRDVVPAMTTVTVHIDPLRTDVSALQRLVRAHDLETPAMYAEAPARLVEIAVSYGGDDGPDLGEVAHATGLTQQEVIARHAAGEYRVCYLGFAPGFAYLGVVSDDLRMPRMSAPRVRVPAGSVALADLFTAVYPSESPGGWHVIGRTSVLLFDAGSASPSRLLPGDRVRFVPSAS